ncbi:MAG: UDP-2,4-diacetamido-2,4,6-trideoxy-beta-L-altropyranose hydrolase [Deltaproteobacteria bacterium]|nr:UDP-2,4-diacetamido-2,4,6-trideoxy-beta-L-altropyranose hydrolase [Deltaproteobacteria bacterium]
MDLNNFLLRADATTEMGTGHIMRCLALAHGLIGQGKEVTLLGRCTHEGLRDRIETSGVRFIAIDRPHPDPADLQRTIEIVSELRIHWVILDGYHFDVNFHRTIRKTGCRLLVVDDSSNLAAYQADILLNQNITARQELYAGSSINTFLLGLKYVLLRPEFLRKRQWLRELPEVAHKVLVTMGGADPDNATLKVIQALQRVNGIELESRVVVGFTNPHLKTLRNAVEKSPCNIDFFVNVQDMSDQMAWADLAVAAAGSTCWELAFMGLPTCTIVIAKNQWPVAERLHEEGFSLNLGWYHSFDLDHCAKTIGDLATDLGKRTFMSRRGRQLVDGKGVQAVITALRKFKERRR